MAAQPPLTVLIIDDDEDDRFFMERAFKVDSPHCRLYLAADGQQAVDMLCLVYPLPDVILLDLNMPGLSGFDVLRHLKQSVQHQHIPVIILTTSDTLYDQQQAHCLGANGFITKPTTQDSLSAIAQQIRRDWPNSNDYANPPKQG